MTIAKRHTFPTSLTKRLIWKEKKKLADPYVRIGLFTYAHLCNWSNLCSIFKGLVVSYTTVSM